MAFIGEPDLPAGLVYPDAVAAQRQFRKFEQGSEDKIFRVVSPKPRLTFLRIIKGHPKQIRRPSRLRRARKSSGQRAKFPFHWLKRSGLRIEQISLITRPGLPGKARVQYQDFVVRGDIS